MKAITIKIDKTKMGLGKNKETCFSNFNEKNYFVSEGVTYYSAKTEKREPSFSINTKKS